MSSAEFEALGYVLVVTRHENSVAAAAYCMKNWRLDRKAAGELQAEAVAALAELVRRALSDPSFAPQSVPFPERPRHLDH